MVSHPQLLAAGLSPSGVARRVRAGRLHRVHRGVYAVGHTALTRRSYELAAVLACGPGAVLSHRSAGALWGLLRWNGRIDVTAPRSRRGRDGFVVHRSRRLAPEDKAVVDGIAVTSVARTAIDLADVLNHHWLARAINEAELRQLLDVAAIDAARARVSGRRGRHRLDRVLAAFRPEPFTRSDGERAFLELCRRHGLPAPKVNLTLAGHEVDFWWPEVGLAVELDSATHHGTRLAFHRDRRRDRELAVQGVQVVRLTGLDLRRERRRVAAELRALLARPG